MRTAELHFHLKENLVRVYLEDAEVTTTQGPGRDIFLINNNELPFTIPPDSKLNMETKIQEKTNAEIADELAKNLHLIASGRKNEAIRDGFAFATGRIDRINWNNVFLAFRDYSDWERKRNELNTEWHLRVSMAFGSLLFVLLGGADRDPICTARFLERFHDLFPADHRNLLSAHADGSQHEQGGSAPAVYIAVARERVPGSGSPAGVAVGGETLSKP